MHRRMIALRCKRYSRSRTLSFYRYRSRKFIPIVIAGIVSRLNNPLRIIGKNKRIRKSSTSFLVVDRDGILLSVFKRKIRIGLLAQRIPVSIMTRPGNVKRSFIRSSYIDSKPRFKRNPHCLCASIRIHVSRKRAITLQNGFVDYVINYASNYSACWIPHLDIYGTIQRQFTVGELIASLDRRHFLLS